VRIYVAAKFELKEEVREFYKKLQEKGHEITADWTLHKLISPYSKNQELAKEYAIEDVKGAKNCDVFILRSAATGTGTYIELGAAIASHLEKGKPHIYVMGKLNERCMFYFHPSVKRLATFEEVLQEIEKLEA